MVLYGPAIRDINVHCTFSVLIVLSEVVSEIVMKASFNHISRHCKTIIANAFLQERFYVELNWKKYLNINMRRDSHCPN